ncbi:8-oxoguanine DNA glycosylase OGG fold protein [Sinomonas terrae]|uniref:Uncharacterized protein n=1 Tax=Sinomonas terrae TaxID=2908838 RepID=A0ABS9U0R9_9MICC|nr:hypothetical protein [Sinomonas terrae]MCH6470240.1 hypothetical protein [Sinomonas terrae]
MPSGIRRRIGARESYVLDHGFDAKTVGVDWWNSRLASHGLHQMVQVFKHGQLGRLTRGDLFQLGRAASAPLAAEDDVLTFLWHVLAWGTGASQRGNEKRIQSFARPADRARNVALLKRATELALDGDPAGAYSSLIRRGGGQIAGLGPAFFTKFLYFASEGTTGTRCLILDARVASRLAQAGWTSLPHSGPSYSYNWYTDTYVSYCELLARWANEETARSKSEVWPDEIERALFSGDDGS